MQQQISNMQQQVSNKPAAFIIIHYFCPADHPAKPMAKDNKNYEQDATNHSIIVLDAPSPCCGQRGRRRQNPS